MEVIGPVLVAIRAKYFEQWRKADAGEWPVIKAKLELADDFKAELRKMINSGDIDNAR